LAHWDLVSEYSPPPFEPYAARASGNKFSYIGERVGVNFVDSAREENKARAVVEIYLDPG